MKRILLFPLIFTFFLGHPQGPEGQYYIDFNNMEMPVSPSAANLGTYGDIPVKTATGIPNITIPMYTMEVDGISIPISISYHASGVKVNEISTAVGLKWSLNAGGGIFRTVKSKPDERGWLVSYGPFPDDWYNGYDPDDKNWQLNFQQLMMGNLGSGSVRGKVSLHDHNPDQYSYSIIGFSGEFILSELGDVLKNQNDELSISFDPDATIVTDQKGNSYYFGGKSETSNSSYTYASTPTGGGHGGMDGYDIDGNVVTGWMLDSIVTKNSKIISFEYSPYTIKENTPHVVANHLSYQAGCSSGPFAESSSTTVVNDYTVQLLTAIRSENIDIELLYDTDSSLSLWKKKLIKIRVSDLLNGLKKDFKLEYGKFNGDPRLKLEKIIEIGYQNNIPTEKPPYEFSYDSSALPPMYSLSQDFFGYYNAASNSTLTPKSEYAETLFGMNNNMRSFYTAHSGNRSLNSSAVSTGMLTQIKYPTGGITKFFYEPNAEYDPVKSTTKYCGGLRVSKIENRTSALAKEPSKTTTYVYEGLHGDDFESNVYKTVRQNFDKDGHSAISYAFNSSFVGHPNEVFSGYFYKKVTTRVLGDSIQHKREDHYEEGQPSFGKYNFNLKAEKIFNGQSLVRISEYEYKTIGPEDQIEWNILGNMRCLEVSNWGGGTNILGYGPGTKCYASGNWIPLPTRIATTEFLRQGTSLKPVTTIQTISYSHQTLLRIEETTDTRFKRLTNGDFIIDDHNGEVRTTHYQYPGSPGIDLELPAALPISKIVHSNKHMDPIFGQYFEYDSAGNIKRTYQYNKGKVGNNGAPAYVPSNYEEMANFLFSNGKPVQVLNKDGEPTTYIWGLNGQFPVAKIEGKARALIPQYIIDNVEGAGYADLPTKLADLRGHPALAGAMVTTFTYKPLAGVETITDPKGDKQNFEYDPFGRLILVRDAQNNILSENEYNYAD